MVILFSMIFVAVVGGGIYFTWRRGRAASEERLPISDRPGRARGQPMAGLLFGGFFLLGGVLVYGLVWLPMSGILNARQWPAVPCTVLSSEVESHNTSDSTTYKVNIRYRYEFNGRRFENDRYDFMIGWTSGRDGKQAIVDRLSPGTRTVCYVNPANPTEAVLERGFTPALWFGLIPFTFAVVGAAGLVLTVRRRRPAGSATTIAGTGTAFSDPALGPADVSHARGVPGQLVLKPRTAPWAKLLGAIFAAVFWNGIVSVFVAQAVASWRAGRPDWTLTLFITPFVLIGLGLVAGIFYFLLALSNPRPRLTLSPAAVPLGGVLRVRWDLDGRTEVLQNLSVYLEGREEAKYRRGTDTLTDTSLFCRMELARMTSSPELRSGTRTVTIPARLMHSFESAHNRICWSIRLHGQIPRWPDLKEEFPVQVLPGGRAGRESS